MSDLNEKDLESTDENLEECDYITLTDDNGEDIHFEVIDEFEFKEKNYLVLIPFEDVDDEVIILEVIYSDTDNAEDDEYRSIDDEALLNSIFEEFKKRNADNFDFAE